jgi:hypothetical protein
VTKTNQCFRSHACRLEIVRELVGSDLQFAVIQLLIAGYQRRGIWSRVRARPYQIRNQPMARFRRARFISDARPFRTDC